MLIQLPLKDFISELASNSSAPGGGSIAALAGSLGAALAVMVCHLTIGNPKYSAVEADMNCLLAAADKLQTELTLLIDEDTNAFNQVMAAYQLPKLTDTEKADRSSAIQKALKEATLLPLSVAERCCELIGLSKQVLHSGNANAASDAAVAGAMANAGLIAAAYNVKINIASIKDQDFVAAMQEKLRELKSSGARLYQELTADADAKIG